jgi:TonB family protein
MKFSLTWASRAAVLASCFLLFSEAVPAQFSKFDELAEQLSKELKPAKPHLVAVADFRSMQEAGAPQGHYFAGLLSEFLRQRANKKFQVSDHSGFDRDLFRLNIAVGGLAPGASLEAAAPQIGADIVITGTIERRQGAYVLQVTPVGIANQVSLATLTQSIIEDDFLDSFVTPFPEGVKSTKDKEYFQGVNMPSCVHCPDPTYSEQARSKRIMQAVVIMNVLISAAGEPQQIRPTQVVGYGLDEQAFNAIRGWKFRPATLKKDGTSLPIIVPIEVTFRLR